MLGPLLIPLSRRYDSDNDQIQDLIQLRYNGVVCRISGSFNDEEVQCIQEVCQHKQRQMHLSLDSGASKGTKGAKEGVGESGT